MYCINCGVKLADTEKVCPLCQTEVYHPKLKQPAALPLYPEGRNPKVQTNSKAFNGILIILFLIPLLVCFLADWQTGGGLEWFGYAAGGLLLLYVSAALPLWFQKPNPVIFVPCSFVAATLFLLYINLATGGTWFLSFAFPVSGGLCLLVTTVVTLVHYVGKGHLYIFGGGLMALGGLMLLTEFLLTVTFPLRFIGWSVYPLIVLVLLGGALIYLAINASARETMQRKLFF